MPNNATLFIAHRPVIISPFVETFPNHQYFTVLQKRTFREKGTRVQTAASLCMHLKYVLRPHPFRQINTAYFVFSSLQSSSCLPVRFQLLPQYYIMISQSQLQVHLADDLPTREENHILTDGWWLAFWCHVSYSVPSRSSEAPCINSQ